MTDAIKNEGNIDLDSYFMKDNFHCGSNKLKASISLIKEELHETIRLI
jgi:hypothetical protein